MNTMFWKSGALGLQCLLSFLATASLGLTAHLCPAQSVDSDDAQLQRMKADYRQWMSKSPRRDLLVEFDPDPLAIGVSDPRFSWVVPLDGRGRKQTAYRLRVASRPELLQSGLADMWDSGLVASPVSTNVFYAGRPLESNRDYFWNVQVQDEAGALQACSRTARFCTALLRDSDWKAQWIGRGSPHEAVADADAFLTGKASPEVQRTEPDLRSFMLRKEFTATNPVQRARLYVSGLGLYEVRLNGKKVGNHVLTPAKTDYRKRVLYDVYDVTAELKKGENAIGVLLGNGWYNAPKRWWGWQMQWYGSPRAILQLEIRYANGSTARIVADGTWKCCVGPIAFSCIYDGEDFDARLEQAGWDMPGFDAQSMGASQFGRGRPAANLPPPCWSRGL